jgi:predicted DNA-binding protein (UPF0251 family)
VPRPTKPRCVQAIPGVTYFKPRGIPLSQLEETVLTVEELEAIRLKDLEDLDGTQAAVRMNVSRPTFQRILEKARAKVAEALVKGKALKIEGGVFNLKTGCFRCSACHHEWNIAIGTSCHPDFRCPVCNETKNERTDLPEAVSDTQ